MVPAAAEHNGSGASTRMVHAVALRRSTQLRRNTDRLEALGTGADEEAVERDWGGGGS